MACHHVLIPVGKMFWRPQMRHAVTLAWSKVKEPATLAQIYVEKKDQISYSEANASDQKMF